MNLLMDLIENVCCCLFRVLFVTGNSSLKIYLNLGFHTFKVNKQVNKQITSK